MFLPSNFVTLLQCYYCIGSQLGPGASQLGCPVLQASSAALAGDLAAQLQHRSAQEAALSESLAQLAVAKQLLQVGLALRSSKDTVPACPAGPQQAENVLLI